MTYNLKTGGVFMVDQCDSGSGLALQPRLFIQTWLLLAPNTLQIRWQHDVTQSASTSILDCHNPVDDVTDVATCAKTQLDSSTF